MVGNYTDAEKLEVIELLIEERRAARNSAFESRFREQWMILKAIAADIRGRQPSSVSRARDLLREAIDGAERSKLRDLGYENGKLRQIAELTIGLWPTLQQALEQFKQEQK
jgi:hypothetical protein